MDQRILVLTPTGRDGVATAELLERASLSPDLCHHVAELIAQLDRGAAAVLVAEEALLGTHLDSLSEWVKRQPAWSDMPFIVLSSRHDSSALRAWREKIVGCLRNVSFLERPLQGVTLTSALQAAARSRNKQYEVQAHLKIQEEAAKELERLVLERTQELESANKELNLQIAERQRIEEQLRHAQKMEAIGQLTGGVAHDFNNMLAIIVGSLNMLSRRLKDAEPGIRKYIEAAQEGASRAAQLTRHLLAFSRQQALNPRIVELNQLVTGMSELLKGALGRDVILETVIGQGTWKVHVDQNQLESAILNVALNARDAMTGGGRLTIETQNADLEERSAAASLGVTCGQYAMISITDTGTGMPPQIAERAFDPFFTTKGIGKGTGLGLSQVYGFVKQSGGTVKIQSEPEKGTSIKIYLPRHYGTQDAEPIPHAEPLQEGNEELILVVDDEDGVRDLAVDALRELGYRVLEASNAHVAMDLLKEYPAIDLLFTDIIMPETNGRKLADQARQIRPDLKVLFTSGYTRNAVVPNGLVEPDGLLIGKPYSLDQLAEKVREVLDVQH